MQLERANSIRLEKEMTERKRAQLELQFTHRMTLLLTEAADSKDALRVTLHKICDFTGWSLGQAWVPGRVSGQIELCSEVCTAHPRFEEFRRASEQTIFSSGVGLIGKVSQSKEPLWVKDVHQAKGFLRADAALSVGLKTAIFCPICANDEVVAVLEFFHVEVREKEEGLVRLLSTITNQLGNLFQKKRAEEALKESERRLKEAQSIAHTGNWEWDIKRNVLIWSDELFQLFDVDINGFGGTYADYIAHVHPADRDAVRAILDKAVHSGDSFTFEHRILCRDNTIRHLQCHGRVVRDPEGNAFKMLGTGQDVTELKETALALAAARQQLEQYAAALEKQVAARTADLQKSIHQLESFCYTIAHDLRAPLRAMSGFTNAILQDYGANLDRQGREYADRIISASQRMDRLIIDLLAYGRLTHASFPTATVSLDSMIRHILVMFGNEIQQSGAIVHVSALPEIRSNAVVLEQVLSNIIGNAIKYVRPGVVPKIEIWAEDFNTSLRVYVRDNGLGIPKEYHERIFGVFERLETEQKHEGTGIGLAIAAKGMERLGGRVGVDSEVGKGSCFWIELPKNHATLLLDR
jgi:signal transduction histidine kinase